MRKNLKGKSSIKAIILSFFFGFFIILAIGFLVSTNWKIYKKKIDLQAKVIELRQEAESLEKTNNELNKNLDYVKSDEYLEKVAREQLDMKKPGEEVVVIQKENSQQKKGVEENKTWWEKLKSIFVK
jgi:cell division protein FtsB